MSRDITLENINRNKLLRANRKPLIAYCTLYRQFDKTGQLLYVGVSNDPQHRTNSHANTAIWFREIHIISLEHFGDRMSALEAECKAIETEFPKYNKRHCAGFTKT